MVREDLPKNARVCGAVKFVIPIRSKRAGNILIAFQIQYPCFDRREATVRQERFPQTSGNRQKVQMERSGWLETVHDTARRDDRKIERRSIITHQK